MKKSKLDGSTMALLEDIPADATRHLVDGSPRTAVYRRGVECWEEWRGDGTCERSHVKYWADIADCPRAWASE